MFVCLRCSNAVLTTLDTLPFCPLHMNTAYVPHNAVEMLQFLTMDAYRDGSSLTPAHSYNDFRFKTYAPVAFRYFRELFGIQPDDFLVSDVTHDVTYQ